MTEETFDDMFLDIDDEDISEVAEELSELHLSELELEIERLRNNLSTDRLDMSFGEIMSMYSRDEIIISPEYQRLFRWDNFQKSRFLESIILGIPIPPIFVAEDKNGKWELVDGLQRISTVISFFNELKNDTKCKNKWTLTRGELIPCLSGLNLDTFPIKHQLKIKRAYCRIEVIKWNSEIDMRYELFNRLNTGGTRLTEQEIRNCIFRGIDSTFNNVLKVMASNPDFIALINVTPEKQEELYLEELALRFLTIYDEWDHINSNFALYMTEFMKKRVSESYDFASKQELFNAVTQILLPLGPKIFRFSNNQFSTSLFDSIYVGLASNIHLYQEDGTQKASEKILSMTSDEAFRKHVGADSSGKNRIKKRVEFAIRHFGE